jgi:hypothetical protein
MQYRKKSNEKELTRGELHFFSNSMQLIMLVNTKEYDHQRCTCECDACYNCETKRSAIIPQAHSLLFAVFPFPYIHLLVFTGGSLQVAYSLLPQCSYPIYTPTNTYTQYISNTKSKNFFFTHASLCPEFD